MSQRPMSQPKTAKTKPSLWMTIRTGWRPYRRLYSYAMPYKVRFIVGLSFGFLASIITSCMPLVLARVANVVFHGATPAPTTLASHPELLQKGPLINLSLILLCLAIPAVMIARSVCGYCNSYYMTWVSAKVLTDIRTQLFAKMLSHSMDFFNKMQSGFLMSRITNDTRMMQTALSSVSSDLFKQPVAIVSGVSVLLYMDWKFTLVTLVLFPSCLVPLNMYGKRARRAVKGEQEELGQMVVTMQETFAGIRVVKSFVREEHQEKSFRRSNRIQFDNSMRITRSMEAVSPLVESIAAIGVGFALLYVYFAHLPAAKFMALLAGIFLLYEPIKTLSRIHIVMQRSIQATVEIFRILDSKSSVEDRPDAIELPRSGGALELDRVSFRYIGGVEDALKDFSLKILPGKSYALVGASGAGKSTILSLILRLYDPTRGVIRIDGRDLRSITQKSLRATHRPRLPGDFSFSRHDFQKHSVRPARRDQGGNLRRCPDRLRARFHHGPAARLRNSHRRQRLPSFRWSAAASRDCPRAPQERADSAPRRSDFRA